MLAVLLATALVGWYRFTSVPTLQLKVLAEEATARLYERGPQGLPDWITEAERKYRGWRIYIVDQSGEDILRRELPPRLASYAGRLKNAGFLDEDIAPTRREDPLLLTPLFTDRNGVAYTIMTDNLRAPVNMLRESDVQVLLLSFALVISGLVCWSLARYVSKPVERLQSSARSLAAGNLEARVGQEFGRRRD